MRITIHGHSLPGRRFCDADGAPLDNVHVGVQERRDPVNLVPGDAAAPTWHLELRVEVDQAGQFDFKGPVVHGRRGDRFLYLTWGDVDGQGRFEMFRRAKLMLNRIDPMLVRSAREAGTALVATIKLTDQCGAPRCARVDAPDLVWAAT